MSHLIESMVMITPGPVVITVGFIGYLVAGLPGACVVALDTCHCQTPADRCADGVAGTWHCPIAVARQEAAGNGDRWRCRCNRPVVVPLTASLKKRDDGFGVADGREPMKKHQRMLWMMAFISSAGMASTTWVLDADERKSPER